MLYKKEQPLKKVASGIFSLRSVGQGIDFINEGEAISDELINEFELRLKKLVEEMLDPALDFKQTTDVKICAYCTYKDICNR